VSSLVVASPTSATPTGPTSCPSSSYFNIAATAAGRNLGKIKLQSVASSGMVGWNLGSVYVPATDASASQFTFLPSDNLAMVADPTSQLAADTGIYGGLWFATAAQVAQRSSAGNPAAFATCIRDTTKTPNGIICKQAGKTVTRLLRCGGWIYITALTPNSQCQPASLTVVDEICT
jgi:hypothetical protein